MRIILFLVILTLLQGCGESPNKKWEVIYGRTMGTSFSIKFEGHELVNKEKIETETHRILKQFDQLMSNWNSESWVTEFNSSKETSWQAVDPAVIEILEVSRDIYSISSGAFDVTISPLIEWWGFGESMRTRKPEEMPPREIMENMGMALLEWDKELSRVRKKKPMLNLNCSAVAKGYGVDLVAEYLESLDIKNFMVEIGGEVRVKGKPEARDSWVLGIRRPDERGQPVFVRVRMSNGQSLATSGDYMNAFQENGKRFSHIIDPRKGMPVDHKLTSVTVLGSDCATVDALATACMVLGSEKGLEMIEGIEGVEAFFITRTGEGYSTSQSKGFSMSLVEAPN